ncbi:MAG: phosphate ABC transporter substrate-binding protein [Clostridium sp.]
MIKRKGLLAFTVAISMVMALTGCSTSSKETKKESAQVLFNGSSTLAPVISKIATNFTEEKKTWNKADASLPESDVTIYVSSGGSGAGVKSIMDGTADFGLIARGVKKDEKSKIEGLKENKVGIDALTISVNPKNPILKVKDNLTKEEIKKIFSGEYKTWNQLDKTLPNKEIVVVTRDIGGGAHEVFQKNIMGDTQVKKDSIQAPSMGALATKIIENEYAIGYASFGVANQNKGKISPLKVDGVQATDATIIDGSYKIQRPLIILNKGEMNTMQKVFMDYIKSEKGIKVIEDMGFIPVK